jgi:nitrate/TMAO reductase-like tetraheme cytochrome c subunit
VRFRLTTRSLTVAAIVLTVVVVGIGVALAGTSGAGFCGACKSHKPYVAAYKKSAHKTVNCEECHTEPGPFFFLTAKMEALQQPISQITGDYQSPILGFVLNQSCRRCHTNAELFKPLSKNGIRVQHKHLIEAGFLCMRCHSTVAHGTAVPEGSRTYPVMDQCLICHNNHYTDSQGQVATASCDLCHAKPPANAKPSSHRNSQWATRHGSIGILSTCSACHTKKNACVECHRGVLMPHQASWITAHGQVVNQRGKTSCQLCHDTTTFCRTCHQVRMPHPKSFLGQHPKIVAQKGSQVCLNCHLLANCQACHEAHSLGTPVGHKLLKGVPYKLPASASPTPGASSTSVQGGV